MLDYDLGLKTTFNGFWARLGREFLNKTGQDSQHCNNVVITENIPAAPVLRSVCDTQPYCFLIL